MLGFQYERDTNYLWKEIAIFNPFTEKYMHTFIQFPYNQFCLVHKIRKYFEWLTKNEHGLNFDYETKIFNDWYEEEYESTTTTTTTAVATTMVPQFIKYEEIGTFIKNNIKDINIPVLVNGEEKKEWLSNFIDNEIINIETICSIPINSLKLIFKSKHCKKHNLNNLACALENVHNFYNWNMYCNKIN